MVRSGWKLRFLDKEFIDRLASVLVVRVIVPWLVELVVYGIQVVGLDDLDECSLEHVSGEIVVNMQCHLERHR
jgi:hypothetical protein